MAHARRKFFDLYSANISQPAEQALHLISGLYEVERQARDMSDGDRWRIRQEMTVPILKKLHDWMLAQRDLVPNGSATAKALDYSLKRWVALTRYLDDGAVPIDNNQVENQIRPWALGRSNWLFAESLRSGKSAGASLSLIQAARPPERWMRTCPMQSVAARICPHFGCRRRPNRDTAKAAMCRLASSATKGLNATGTSPLRQVQR